MTGDEDYASASRSAWTTPFPIPHFRQILAEFIDVLLVLDQLVLELLFKINASGSGLRQTINRVHDEMKTIEIVQHRHVERRGDRAFFLVAADVDVVMISAAISQPVDQPRIRMKRKNDRFIFREQRIKIHVTQAVRMFALWLQSHEVNNIDDADF